MILNVVIPNYGNYLGRGAEYVHKLMRGTRRFMPPEIDARYWVITDDPSCAPDFATALPAPEGIEGWWITLASFKPGMLPQGERAVYFDLDMLPVSEMDFLRYRGPFAMLRDPYHPTHVNSSVTMWTVGEADKVWIKWEAGGKPMFEPGRDHPGGDQFFTEQCFGVENIVKLQDVYPGQVVSYKADCRALGGLPDSATMLMFHGVPRPHETGDWAQDLWERA